MVRAIGFGQGSAARRLKSAAASFGLIALSFTPALAQSRSVEDELLVLLWLLPLLLALYVLPTIVAFWTGHRHRWPIAIVNIVLGGSIVFWVVACVWALIPVDAAESAGDPAGEPSTSQPLPNDASESGKASAVASAGEPAVADLGASLEKLVQLRASNAITEAEYAELRKREIDRHART